MKRLVRVGVVVVLIAGGFAFWKLNQKSSLPEGIVSGNGRIEATQTDVAPKYAGRVKEILAKQGDLVAAGQVLVQMETSEFEAQLANALAREKEAEANLAGAEANIKQSEADIEVAKSDIVKSEHDVTFARQQTARADELLSKKVMSKEEHDKRLTELNVSMAALEAANAKRRAVEAASDAANSKRRAAKKGIDAYTADARLVQSQIDDSTLKAAVEGRVLYRLAEPNEVLSAGGKALTLVSLEDVYMTIYLPSQEATRLKMGGEGRIVLDAAPDFAVRAHITFVAPEAQFTPKQVETKSERDKLMFKVKLTVPPETVKKYIERVKLGIRGEGYVRTDESVAWPPFLEREFAGAKP